MSKWHSAYEKIPEEGKMVLICYHYRHWVWSPDSEVREPKDAIGYGVGCIWENKWCVHEREMPDGILIAWRDFPRLPKDFENRWMEKMLQHRGKKSVVK